MKRIISSILISIIFFSCNQRSSTVIQEEQYTLLIPSIAENMAIELPKKEPLPIEDEIRGFEFLQSQAIRFLSMGYNARQDSGGNTYYYLYGYEDYSEALVFSDSVALITEATAKYSSFYPQGRSIGYCLPAYTYIVDGDPDRFISIEWGIPTTGGWVSELHEYENGRLVYWATEYDRSLSAESVSIQQNTESILIDYIIKDGRVFQEKFYNISQDELLDIFLKNYIGLICEIDDLLNGKIVSWTMGEDFVEGYFFDGAASYLFRGRTSRELAIFRNCLYAIKGYRFASSSWTEFFDKYLPNYNAQYSNAEVTTMFTDNEMRLLDLIIEYETRR
jgi:hypothetical protein